MAEVLSTRGGGPVVAVLGASGFVGAAVVRALRERGVSVRPLAAPRLRWFPVSPSGRLVAPRLHLADVEALAARLDRVRVVVNAAGLPDGTAPATPQLYGANALLPLLVARACGLVGVERFVHVSSAAVQGPRDLDETSRTAAFSPYSDAKALGEHLLGQQDDVDHVIHRSTWVHDVDRPNTMSLVRFARSTASCVAGDGSAPTPQVLLDDVGAAVAYLALVGGPVPRIVLQPPSGMTTGMILRLLGGGREPRHLSDPVARLLSGSARACAGLNARTSAYARRMHMLLFGKAQDPGWLAGRSVVAPLCPQAWRRLATSAVPVRGDVTGVETDVADVTDVTGAAGASARMTA